MEVPTYDLAESAIAQRPSARRDEARLLDALDATGAIYHRHVRDLPALVGPGDVVVVNTTKVLPARLRLRKKTGGAAEVLLLEPDPRDPRCWEALVRPGRRLPPGTLLWAYGESPAVEIGERLDEGRRRVRVLEGEVSDYGEVALPPYVHESLADPSRYQTVYADRPGSVAAPTAGLHLTTHVLDECRRRGASVCDVDLAIGLATFKPISNGSVEAHRMHRERYRVPDHTWQACADADRVIAVGTTTVRALESVAASGRLEGSTDLYIRPGFSFTVVDVLLTNFHLPRSTLLVMLEAFCGPRWRELYAVAHSNGYRFLSFGDAMIVARA